MATAEQSYFRAELEQRRERLHAAVHTQTADGSLSRLLDEVDAALERLAHGSFGVCEFCKGKIEPERLLADPLLSFCLECLSQEEQRALEKDLTLAGSIQQRLLPRKDFAAPGWQVRYHYEPAGLISGDYCDLIETPTGLLFLIGDVSGKGVAASMLMSHLNATFRSLADSNLPLDRMVKAANRIFCESTLASHYATLIVGRTVEDGGIEFVSAGHPPLLHVHRNGASPHEATGVPLGMFSDASFSLRKLALQPGDSLLLYTDGLTEAENHSGEQYGLGRVVQLAANLATAAPEHLLAGFLSDLRNHSAGGRRADDLTLLVIRRSA